MRIVLRIAIVIFGLALTGTVALFAAGAMADAGMTGSCFEGACAYAALFFVFPLLWAGLFVVFLVFWWGLVRRRYRE